MSGHSRYRPFDAYEVGETDRSLGRTINEADVVLFTSLAGIKAPIFVDAEFARKESRYGRRIVPGLLTASIAAGMMEDILGPYVVAALEVGPMRFPHPLFPGDTVHALIHAVEARPTSDGRHGVLGVRTELFNQDEVQVFEMAAKFLMKRDA
jgi:3-hydroxybutyryl-CoA dehydratase